MKKVLFGLCGLAVFFCCLSVLSAAENAETFEKIYGLDVSLYVKGLNPNYGDVITPHLAKKYVKIIAPYVERIRIFGSTHGLENIVRNANKYGIPVVASAWLGRDDEANQEEMDKLVEICQSNNNIILAIVGSEVLLRNDMTPDKLIGYINYFRERVPGVPVTTADIADRIMCHPEVAAACDVVAANFYPYWEGIPVEIAVAHVHKAYNILKNKYPEKQVIVSETGWPSDGDAVGEAIPSPENAAFYFKNIISWAKAENIPVYYFEAVDERWKEASEGPQGSHWGVWTEKGKLKPGMKEVFLGATMPNNWTCPEPIPGNGQPTIEPTFIPPKGSKGWLKGQVWDISPGAYNLAVYIYVPDCYNWWTKPTFGNPITIVECDGSWTCNITTGGCDTEATRIAVFAIPVDYSPPLLAGVSKLPNELFEVSVANIIIER